MRQPTKSDIFPGGQWSQPSRFAFGVAMEEMHSPEADVLAELAWPEANKLLGVGQSMSLSGSLYRFELGRIDETTIVCLLWDGTWGRYEHDDDLAWKRRRAEAMAMLRQLESGGDLEV